MVAIEEHERYMALALRLAERGRGQTSPNPMVGAVVVTEDGVVAGLGHHPRAGAPHAEAHALGMAGPRANGATLYCTLEPCCHVGRTGPCVVAIAQAGIARVVAATSDPNPLVAGRGFEYLRRHGIEVLTGVLAREAARLNVAFFTAMTTGRPWVVMKVATSLDGRVSAAPGVRTTLTSAPVNRLAHRLRAEIDALAIGAQTVLVDDPLLTVRGVWRGRPLVRVVFDSRLRMPSSARLLQTLDVGPVVVVTTSGDDPAHAARAEALTAVGAEIVDVPRYDVGAALRALGARQVRSLLVEGGPTLHRAFWQARAVDHVWAIIAPCLLGREGVAWDMPSDFSLAGLERPKVTPIGPDVLVEGDVYRTH